MHTPQSTFFGTPSHYVFSLRRFVTPLRWVSRWGLPLWAGGLRRAALQPQRRVENAPRYGVHVVGAPGGPPAFPWAGLVHLDATNANAPPSPVCSYTRAWTRVLPH
jgi:hypothetical protein